ncbi:hypothetical protein [Inhella sp.]|uniref:hypothetical protein n=1 Tax=Inhella sp. TaxID=1921806 RepID=UPI0035AF56CF
MRLIALALLLVPTWVQAWGNHALLSYRAFEGMPEVAQAAPVRVEPLDDFLRAQESRLVNMLDAQEAWARREIRAYAPRPDALRFTPQPGDAERRAAFLRALRLSPHAAFALFVQPDPRRQGQVEQGLMPHELVSSVPLSKGATQRFLPLQTGQAVAPLAVLASASDEADYGYDIDLFEDNRGAPVGYDFGRQPFGNPALRISSQAPFHMGFFHQGAVFNTLAPGFARTFTQLRIHQYSTLAQLAFETGHRYWGWRFAGLALHYLQDLTQPYHASAAPGERLSGMLWAELLAKLGSPARKQGLIVLQSNRHFVLEKYQTQLVLAAALAGRDDGLNEQALRDMKADGAYPAWHAQYARDVVAAEAHALGPETDTAIVVGAPARYVTDPSFDFGATESGLDLDADMRRQLLAQREAFQAAVARLLRNFGAHSRNAVRGMLR